ncbi:MAG TPA: phosphotransferase [Cellvibrionaceae bacterium]
MTMITAPEDTRLLALTAWVSEQKNCACLLSPLGGDAGARRYFTLAEDDNLLAVDAPPASENTVQFIQVAKCFSEQGVTVPAIIAADVAQGFLLVEHWHEGLFYQHVSGDNNPLLYGEALIKLLAIQQIPSQVANLPVFDSAFIQRELALFNDWFLAGELNYQISASEQQLLQQTFAVLEQSALAQPQVVMHRDYHSRNLLLGRGGQLAVIDFQDAVIGPVTYDLVSLLKDCYHQLPLEQVQQWALSYGDMALDAGVLPPLDARQFIRWFDLMGLQRHLKVLGIFARLNRRDNKSAYLKDLPRVLGYVLQTTEQYSELAEFSHWLKHTILPLCRTRPWWWEPQVL